MKIDIDLFYVLKRVFFVFFHCFAFVRKALQQQNEREAFGWPGWLMRHAVFVAASSGSSFCQAQT